MDCDKSTVMTEFFKFAAEHDLLKTAYPAKNPYQENKKTIEEKRLKTPEKNIMEVAHPKPVYVANARGDGGLVENEIENQKKMIEVLNKLPHGTLVGVYANAINELVKIANECDNLGEKPAADILTNAAIKLMEDIEKLPLKLAL